MQSVKTAPKKPNLRPKPKPRETVIRVPHTAKPAIVAVTTKKH